VEDGKFLALARQLSAGSLRHSGVPCSALDGWQFAKLY
jgi:hypothetical protein